MQGLKDVELDFEIDVSHKGDTERVNVIKLASPSLRNFNIHNYFSSTVKRSLFKLAMDLPDNEKEGQKKLEDEGQIDSDGSMNVLTILEMTMTTTEFQKAMIDVRGFLTKRPALAWVVIDGQNIGLSDSIWDQLFDKGGMDSVFKVIGAYFDFFTVKDQLEKERK